MYMYLSYMCGYLLLTTHLQLIQSHCYKSMCYIPVQVSSDPGNQYSVSLMNSLVLYVGTQAIGFIHSKGNTPSTSTIAHTAHMDIFQHLVVDLDTEGMHATLCVHNMCCVGKLF